VNVAHPAEVAGAVAEIIARWGRVDVLVNNAGILRDAQMVKWKDGQVASLMTTRCSTRSSTSTSRPSSTARVPWCRT